MGKRDREERDGRVSARKRAETHTSGFTSNAYKLPAGVEEFQVEKAGIKRLDIIPYRVGAGNPQAEEGEIYFERTYFVHRGIGADEGMYVCPAKTAGKKCPICQDALRMRRDPDGDKELIKALAPRERQLFNVIDLDNREAGVQVWEMSFHNFGKMLDARIKDSDDEEDGYAFFSDLKAGMTLKVGFADASFSGNKFLEASSIDFKPRAKPYNKSILDEATCLDECLIILPYDKLKAIYLQEEDEEEEERPTSSSRSGTGGRTSRPSEPEDEEEEEEEETPPPKKKRKPAPVEEEDDEDEPEPPPKKKKPKPAPVEEEDEEEEEEPDEPPKLKKKPKRAPEP
jgi:hypothetical protein